MPSCATTTSGAAIGTIGSTAECPRKHYVKRSARTPYRTWRSILARQRQPNPTQLNYRGRYRIRKHLDCNDAQKTGCLGITELVQFEEPGAPRQNLTPIRPV
jgi:hypothetical protein